MKNQGITKIINSFEGDMNACTKFHGNTSNSFKDIPLKATNINHMVALEEKSGITKVIGIHLLGAMNVFKKKNCANLSSRC